MNQLSRVDIRTWIEAVDEDAHPRGWLKDPGALMWTHYSDALRGDMGSFRLLAHDAILLAAQLGHDIVAPAIRTNETKGADYTGSSPDPLNNFYKVAGRTVAAGYRCTDAISTWAVYVAKHLDAIETFQATGRVASEPIESRLMDVLVYSALGYFIMLRKKGIQHVPYTSRSAGQLGAAAAASNRQS